MTSGPEDPLTLTGPHNEIEAAVETCQSQATDLSEPLFEACRDHTDTILTALLEEPDVTPGVELADDRDVTAFRQYITNQLTEYWFADLNGRGSDRDLNWNTFKSVVRLYTEAAYLRAFTAYKTARETFTAIERDRTTAERLYAEQAQYHGL